ncbi:chemotaxis protein CheW [Chitinimonas sp. BJYL2]|uniref:chemotaxis protein CheW n=1 Tax=Chitinimonas sp. BJYL2 TaxID=2976696 RepID=UPI0022B36F7D|nr:chemotaxis protein CheW [Chitinimonas sp. BJYL2]
MEIDLSKFFSTFFEEAEEHLANFENLLLELDLSAPEPEDLNAIFRAAHSIKGGAGTFGFNDLAALTHILENLLDRVRKGTTALRPDMVDIFLRTSDVLAGMLAVHRDGAAPDTAAVAEVTEALTRLEHEAIHGGSRPAPAVAPTPAPASTHASPPAWRLTLRLDASTPPQSLIDALASYGDVVRHEERTHDDGVHLILGLIGPSDQDLRDALGFVLSEDRFTIEPDPTHQPAPETATLAGEGETFGFFDDEPAATPAPAPLSGEGEAFGFFDDDEPASTPVAPADIPAVASSDYGFFEPLPPVAPDAPAGREGIDYGWLDPNAAKATPPAPTPAPVASPAVGAPPADTVGTGRRATDKSESATIRVDVSKVDQLLNFVGELVITQSMLAQSASNLDPLQHTRLLAGIEQLQRNTRELQESVMSIRMIPMSTVFSRFPRVVRDLAGKLGKKVELRLVGEQTELDKGFVEKLVDPLTHLVRNSLDHGIESTEARVARGKPETGNLTLAASQQGGNVVIEVRDDGAGLNRERILAKARENGIPVTDNMSDSEVWLLIFEAGFSTAAEVTDVSGRGVGMDVVRKNIQSMGGTVEIESMTGIGSTMRIRLPLTLAILDGMLVDAGGETYILPLNAIRESLQPTPEQCKTVTGSGRVVQVREEYLPLIALHEVVGCQPKSATPSGGIVMVIEVGNQQIALWVDELLGQQQVVVKNLESNYRRVRGISGATILGDGRVALIVDISELSRTSTG